MRLNLDPYTPWLKNKGIAPKTAQIFEAGLYLGSGFLSDCIAVRLHDLKGLPLGYAGRRLNPEHAKKYGKWKFQPGFPKSKILFNFHRIQPNLKQSVVIVECPWGVMRLAQLNIPALALLGTTLAPDLYDLFRDISQVILMLDGDMAGQKATVNLWNSLKSITQVDYVLLPPNHDPDDLNDDTLISILKYLSL